jgi:hypothetical protein
VRYDNYLAIGRTILLASDCVKPDSVALAERHLFVVGTNCAESHDWPSGNLDGPVVSLADPSAAQIAVGKTWAAVTLASGSVLQLPLTHEEGSLNGMDTTITLPSNANSVPLGAAFWGNNLGFTPAHSPRQLRHYRRGSQHFPHRRSHSFLPNQCSLLGRQGTGQRLVYRQFPG